MEYIEPQEKKEKTHINYWPYLKWGAIIFWSLVVIIVIIVNIDGCTTIIERNITRNITINRTINNTIYIYNTTIEQCNITCKNCPPCSEYNRDYVLSLIRQLKRLEENQDKYWNNTECYDDLNHTDIELKECKAELCNEWNSSWC